MNGSSSREAKLEKVYLARSGSARRSCCAGSASIASVLEFLYSRRVPEPEVMDETEEVDSYAGATAARHLARLDGRFVNQLIRDTAAGRTLDVGCGPGQIVLGYLKGRRKADPRARAFGVDLSLPMLREARRNGLLGVAVANASALPFRDGAFDLVFCNSVLHHMAEPSRDVAEMARCVSGGGRLLIRDLRRPPRPLLQAHIAFLGRHYAGRMKQLFDASVRAAYTPAEARRLLGQARGARVRRRGLSYLEAGWTRPSLS
jgi:ubiquinone/menaquinone biosynthesis C-methylase UbiE